MNDTSTPTAEAYSVLDEAHIHQGEFARIIDRSRVMVNRYVKGRSTPGKFDAPRIRRALDLLHGLVEAGKLPLPHDYDREQRQRAVEKIRAHLNKPA